MTTTTGRKSPYTYATTPRRDIPRQLGFGQRFLAGQGTKPNLLLEHQDIASIPGAITNLSHHKNQFPLTNARIVGPQIGAGAYGTAHKTVVSNFLSEMHKEMRREMKYGIFKEFPRVGTQVITKSQAMDESNLAGNLKEAMKETVVHDMLSHAAPISLGRDFRRELRPANYVPKLYFAGMVVCDACSRNEKIRTPGGDGTEERLVYYRLSFATVMGVAPGEEVTKYLRTNPLTASFYVGMERAICSIWAAGFVHADIHTSNMLYDETTGKFTIIDFGFGIKMTNDLRAQVLRKMVEGVRIGVKSMGEIFRPATQATIGAGVQNYVNKVLRSRNSVFSHPQAWHNPDGTQLISQYNALPESERIKVAGLRRQRWGYSPPAPPPPPRRASRLAGRVNAAPPAPAAAAGRLRPAEVKGRSEWQKFLGEYVKGKNNTPTNMNID